MVMKKHTNLWNEIYKGKKPDTSWADTLIAVALIIFVCYAILIAVNLLEVMQII